MVVSLMLTRGPYVLFWIVPGHPGHWTPISCRRLEALTLREALATAHLWRLVDAGRRAYWLGEWEA